MGNFFYDYMTEDERNIELEYLKNMNDFSKIQLAAESAAMAHEIRLSDIDTKAMFESYTDDDLELAYSREMSIYTEAANGLFAKLIQKIKNIWYAITGQTQKIKNAKIDSEEKIEVPCNPGKLHTLLTSATTTLKNFFSLKKKDEETGQTKWNLSGIFAVGSTAILGGAGIIHHVSKHMHDLNVIETEGAVYIQAKEAPNWIKKIDDAAVAMQKAADNLTGKANNAEDTGLVKRITGGVISLAAKFVKILAAGLKKITGSEYDPQVKDPDDNNSDNNSTDTNSNGSSDNNSNSLDSKKSKKHMKNAQKHLKNVLSKDELELYNSKKFKEWLGDIHSCVRKYMYTKNPDNKHFLDSKRYSKKGKIKISGNDYKRLVSELRKHKSVLEEYYSSRLNTFDKVADIMVKLDKRNLNESTVWTESTMSEDRDDVLVSMYQVSYDEYGNKETTITEYTQDDVDDSDYSYDIDTLYESYNNDIESLNDLIDLL